MDLVALLIQVVVGVIFIAPVLWLAGRALVGKDKAKFTDAIWIVVLGLVIGTVVNFFLDGQAALLVMVMILLALIKHYFDCGWLKALVIVILAGIIFIIMMVVLGLIGIGIGVALLG